MERGTSSSSSIWRPNVEISPSCPRCGSSNTKFCYYNNYSLTQPRYFCKGCRRYWTKGGSLRNVPVGGGCRKTRRPKSSSASSGKNPSGGCYNNHNNGKEESCGSASARPNIDLAAVYANFLNPNPGSKSKNEPHNGFDLDSCGSPLINSVENPKDHASLGLTWSSEINDHHHGYHHLRHHPMLYAGQEPNSVQECNFGLPPLPGEELVATDHGVWSDTLLIGNQTGTLPVQENEPVVHFGEEPDDPTNLLFGSWSPFDFSADG